MALFFGIVNGFFAVIMLSDIVRSSIINCWNEGCGAGIISLLAFLPSILNVIIFGILSARNWVNLRKSTQEAYSSVVKKIELKYKLAILLLLSPMILFTITFIVSNLTYNYN